MKPLTPLDIIAAYTGFSLTEGDFQKIHSYAEKMLGRPVYIHEFADKETWNKLRDAIKESGDFKTAVTEINRALAESPTKVKP